MDELTMTTTETTTGTEDETERVDIGERCGRFFQYSAAHAWDALAKLCAPDARFARNGSETDLTLVQQRESERLAEAYVSPEHKEAVAAFLEKRAPDYRAAAELARASQADK